MTSLSPTHDMAHALNGSPETWGGHLPALDGVRGLAIALVLLTHVTPWRGTQGGWIGVDLFFVLSGFLITGVLLEGKSDRGRGRTFYARRSLRILPLYYGVLVVLFVLIPLVHPLHTVEYRALAGEQWWYWSYLANWRVGSAHPVDGGSLGWFWSLAIEEQFYLVWPLVVWYGSRRTVSRVSIGVLVVGLLARVAIAIVRPDLMQNSLTVYVLTPCRLDGLVLGALLALGIRAPNGYARTVRWVRPTAIAAAVFLGAMLAHDWAAGLAPFTRTLAMQTVGYSALAVAFGGVLVAALNPWGVAFSSAPLRWLGRYSYGIYIIHPFIIRALRQRSTLLFGGWTFALVAVVASLSGAWLSYHLYEQPWLRLKKRFSPPQAKASSCVLTGEQLPISLPAAAVMPA